MDPIQIERIINYDSEHQSTLPYCLHIIIFHGSSFAIYPEADLRVFKAKRVDQSATLRALDDFWGDLPGITTLRASKPRKIVIF